MAGGTGNTLFFTTDDKNGILIVLIDWRNMIFQGIANELLLPLTSFISPHNAATGYTDLQALPEPRRANSETLLHHVASFPFVLTLI